MSHSLFCSVHYHPSHSLPVLLSVCLTLCSVHYHLSHSVYKARLWIRSVGPVPQGLRLPGASKPQGKLPTRPLGAYSMSSQLWPPRPLSGDSVKAPQWLQCEAPQAPQWVQCEAPQAPRVFTSSATPGPLGTVHRLHI